MHDFKRLRTWQEARTLSRDIHLLVRTFPPSDRQVIASQLRRCALSISATIAEGCGKESRAETIRYLQIAAGSASETENHLIAAADLGYITERARDELSLKTTSIQRMLRALCKNLPP